MGMLSWLRRRRLDDVDLQAEIQSHLRLDVDERIARGDDPATARREALHDLGDVARVKDDARRTWTPRWLERLHDLADDVRYAVRSLTAQPGFALAVVGVLTLGIGANAAVFTMLKGIAFTPLAGVDRSDRLVVVHGETSSGRELRVSYPDYTHLRDHTDAFADLFGSGLATVTLGEGRSARQAWAELVTGNYFSALGVRPQLGRTLQPSDEVAPGAHPVAVISDAYWRRDLGANPDVIGTTIEINNYPLTIVGVADATFHGTIVSYDVDLFVPVMMAPQILVTGQPTMLAERGTGVVFPQGFLAPGVTREAAAARIDAAWATLSADRPITDAAQRLRLAPFWRSPTGAQTFILPTLGVLTIMGVFVLLVACANIAGLVLVRGVARRGELAVRLAIGATRARIVRLLVLENLVLAVPGTVFGITLALRGIPLLIAYADQLAAPQHVFFNTAVDGVVIAFAVLVACGSALVFGFVPALQNSRIDLVSVINEDASTRGAARGRLRSSLVVAQVAVSLLLLVGAGLASRSVDAARRADPGFDMRQVTAVETDVRQAGYDEARGRVFYRKLLDAARADRGVEVATLAAETPLGLLDSGARRVEIQGYEPRKGEDLALLWNTVGPDYFTTLRIALVAGRGFDDRDDEGAAQVAVVNATLAGRFWGGADNALGKRVRLGDDEWRTVVGVAADVKYSRINEAPRPYLYVPFFQAYRSRMVLQAKGSGAVESLVDQARANIASVDADVPVLSARSLAQATRGAFIFFDLAATMLLVFGAAGMLLAAMGTYGLVSYNVKQRTREIGIRMALGASALSVVRAFLGGGLRLGVAGAALGAAAALGLAQLLGSALFGVSPTDVPSFARALAVVLITVIMATLIPAWRASRTDPLRALRHQ